MINNIRKYAVLSVCTLVALMTMSLIYSCAMQKMSLDIRLTVSDFLFQDEDEAGEFGLYSYFLLPRKPANNAEIARYKMFLQSFRTILTYEEYTAYDKLNTLPKDKINITYWPLSIESTADSSFAYRIRNDVLPDSIYIDNYDYARAKMILMNIPDLKGNGPFIVSYGYPLSRSGQEFSKKEMLIMDLSRIDDSLFIDIVDRFQKKVTENPNTWQDKFDWELIRINFYSALKIHAQPVIYAATWVKDFFGLTKIFGGS